MFVLLLSVAGMKNAHAQNFTVGNLNYSVNDDGVSVTVVGYVEYDLDVDIPESVSDNGTSYTVNCIGESAFYDYNPNGLNLSVTIPSTISSTGYLPFQGANFTTVNYNAINCTLSSQNSIFTDCSSLTNLNIGEGVQVIPNYMFWGAGFSGTLTIPESVASIGCYAFANNGFTTLNFNATNCTMGIFYYYYGWDVGVFANCPLTTLNIGNNVQTIPYKAFDGHSSLSGTLVIPSSVTTIGGYAFNGCSGLTGALNIPNSVTTIGEYAFANTGFTGTLPLPNSLTSIGEGAFQDCSLTGSLTIGTNITSIGQNAFANCLGLTGIVFNATNCTAIGYYRNDTNSFDYYYGNGQYYTDDPYCYFTSAFSGCSNITSLQIGEGVQVIPNGAFRDLSGITGNFNIPSSVVTIGDYAFAGTGLSGVLTIPENVTSVGLKAFANTGVTAINFNATDCSTIGYLYWLNSGYNELEFISAFYGCSNIESLQIGENVQQIPTGAFKDLQGISGALNLPNSVETIGDYSFDNIGATGTLVIPESVTSIGSYAFSNNGFTTLNFNATNCTAMGTGWLWSNGTDIPVSTFYNCNNLTTLNLGSEVQTIPDYAFVSCNTLEGSLTLPNSLQSIGMRSFYGCSGFTGELVIPNLVDTIDSQAFRNCTGFSGTLTIGTNVSAVSGNAFMNTGFTTMNYNATNCTIGGSVWNDYYGYQFAPNSFTGMPSLTTLNIGNNVESISDIAFKDCSTLTGNLILPNSLTSIGDQAFYNCSGLEGIVMGNSVETIGNEAFRNCGGIRGELTLPATLLSVGNHAFASCDEITTVNYNATSCTQMGDAQHPVFFDCASLAHINIGDNVLSIPNYAFKRCSTVEDMTVAVAVPPTIGASTFATVSRSIPVIVPFGSGDDYRNAAYWQEFFNITEGYGPTPNSNHWQPNPHQSAFNMTVIGIIQIGGVEQTVGTLEIGAFCNDECRGSQILTYYPPIDRYLLFFTLYGEHNDQLTFRLYDHATSQESLLVCTEVMTFVPDNIVGSYQDPHVFNFVSIQNSILSQGWNWHSSYVELGTGSLDMMTNSLGESGLMIKSQSNGFTTYDAGEWFGTLTTVNNESTYLINTSADCVMSVAGSFVTPDQHPITLSNGWNWIGYPSTNALDLNTALGGLAAQDGDMIKNQDNFSVYIAGMGWVGSFNTIYPGTGLMYNSSATGNTSFVYANGGRCLDEIPSMTDNHWMANRQAYPYNMSVMAVVCLDENELGGDAELAAFDGDECRGSARLLYVEHLDRYVAFLTVTGEEAATLTLKLYDHETGMEYENPNSSLNFEVDGIVGSLANPFIVDFSTTTETDEPFANGLAAYPNPVNANGLVRINMPYESEARVEIVNALGAMVSAENVTGSSSAIKAPATKGVYVMKVAIDGKGIYTCKLIVE